MDTIHDGHRHLYPQKHIHLASAPALSTYLNDTDAMTAKHEEKLSTVQDKSQEPADSAKPSKKPRHRHSPTQLAALNELFEKSEHPALEERSLLAEKLGMEPKTVNAWFQNKRASTKKRNKGGTSESHPTTSQNDLSEDVLKTPSALPSIANLLNDAPSSVSPQSTQARSYPSARRAKRKDLHSSDIHFTHSDGANDLPQEGVLESSFFAGPPEYFSVQDRFISHRRGPDTEDGAVPSLPNADTDRFPPDSDSRFVSENDGAADGHSAKKGRTESSRMRTSPRQTEELRRAYAINAHPTREQRQELADRIGMKLQSVTNWFQNQRSQAKKHKDEPRPALVPSPRTGDATREPSLRNDSDNILHWQHLPAPSRPRRPSLTMPENGRPSLQNVSSSAVEPLNRMSLPPPTHHPPSSRTRRSITPYARYIHSDEPRPYKNGTVESVRTEDILARNRRSRPQPHQLQALKKLLRLTSTPSIEERTKLAFEIEMDVTRVTNWFRNIRQTARRRANQARASSVSRSRRRDRSEHDSSSGSSACDEEDAMDLDYEDLMDRELDDWSEEEFQEAVTPSSGVSLSPPPAKRPRPHLSAHRRMGNMTVESMGVGLIEPGAFQELEKAVGMSTVGATSDDALDSGMNAVTGTGVKIEDALLLLSFHQHVVH